MAVRNDRVAEFFTARLSERNTSTGVSPCQALSRIECLANPVSAAASGPVPQTSPMTIAH